MCTPPHLGRGLCFGQPGHQCFFYVQSRWILWPSALSRNPNNHEHMQSRFSPMMELGENIGNRFVYTARCFGYIVYPCPPHMLQLVLWVLANFETQPLIGSHWSVLPWPRPGQAWPGPARARAGPAQATYFGNGE